jgi:outer membrane lipoprotein-sorting protein
MGVMLNRPTCSLVLVVCLYFSLDGCLVRRRVIQRGGKSTVQKLLTASEKELEELVAEQFKAVQDFSATVDMVPALGSAEKSRITEYKDVRAYILFRKQAFIRLIGLFPVVRNKAFDMVSNGNQFELYLPSKNLFIQGRNDVTALSPNKIENWRPQHFLEALLVHPVEPDEKPFLLNLTDEDDASYILVLVHTGPNGDMHIARSIWVDRINLRIARLLVFDDTGNILTDARYTQWQVYDGVPFPKQIVLNRPRDEYSVVITMVKLDINKGVAEDKFVLEQPEGTQLRTLTEKGLSPAQPAPAPKPAPKKKR